MLIAVFGALAPTLSHALVWSQGGREAWTEVFTSTGTRWVMRGSTASPDGPEAALSLDHCPFCLLSTDRGAPPPNALLHLFVVSGEPEAPTLRQASF